MESAVKVTCSPASIDALYQAKILDIRFYSFDVEDNGFDPRMLTADDWLEITKEPWIYNLTIRHLDNIAVNDSYPNLDSLVKDIKTKEQRYALSLGALSYERRKRA